MGSYTPRHLKHEPRFLTSKVGRRGLAVAAGAALAVPSAAAMSSASAAPVTASAVKASSVKAATHAVAPAARFTNHVAVQHYGSHGYYVRVVQKRIGGLAVDGNFGPRTLAAVKHYQRTHRLAVDGYVGPRTWYSMGGFPGSRHTSPKPPSRGGSGHSSSAAVNVAKQYIGTPYVYGGESPSGFDCSGFVQYVFSRIGHNLPRTASAQQRATYRVSNPRPGDLVFFGSPAYHVGIYVGHGKMISARKPGTVVGIGGIWAAHSYHRVG